MAPSNPIQKKVRNAGLIGSLITLVIMGIIVGFLLMQLNKIKQEQKEIEQSYVSVYTIAQDVKSGQILTEDMFQLSTAQIEHIPANATSNFDTFKTYSLTDNEKNRVYSDEKGMFLNKNCEYMEIYKDGNKYYTYSINGQKQEVQGINSRDIYEDTYGTYKVTDVEGKNRLYKEDATEKYYILRVKYDTNADGKPTREKEYVEILGVPLVAKIDMNMNTVLTIDMMARGELLEDDVRKQEYNSIILPMDLTTGDYIDVRLKLPSGQDFIVVSKKIVEIPVVGGLESEDTIWINLSEDEILTLSCAIVESYRIQGSKLYATKYIDPGMQNESVITYPVNAEVVELIKADPNVTQEAQKALRERYTQAMVNIRNNNINSQLNKEENSMENVTNKMQESIANSQADRKKYLESLQGGTGNDYDEEEE